MWILCSLVVLTVLILLACWYAYRMCFYSPEGKRIRGDERLQGADYEAVADDVSRISGIMQKIPFEEVTIVSHDGIILYGRYYHIRDGAPVEILCHGYRGHAYRDCSGGHALSRKLGFNSLVVDQRAHGKSGGKTISFGIQERFDVCRWTTYCAERFGKDVPLILSGLSMGAATVLMASDLDLPDSVCCIIADSPYSSPAGIIEKVAKDMRYPVALCRPFLHLSARIFGGFRLNACSAKGAVHQAKVPILLIHGERDHFVPCEMSLEIAACCVSRVEVVTFPGAAHGLSYMTDPVRYEKAVCSFLQSVPLLRNHINPEYLSHLRELTEQ